MTMRVYEYGALAPAENLDLVKSQVRLAHAYGNKLVEIERERRERVQRAQVGHEDVAPLNDKVKDLEAKLEAVRERISKSRQKNRANKAAPADLAEAKELKKTLKDARVQLREAKARARGDEAVANALRDADEWAKDAVRRARADFAKKGLFWGSYLVVEQAADAARKSITPPKFKRWDGRGHLAVQIQKGIDVKDLLSCTDTRVRLTSPPPEAFATSGQRKLKRTQIRMRIQSDGRDPVWTTIPIVMHRPIREGAKIKWVHLICDRIADEEKWKVQLVADESACGPRPDPNVDKEENRGVCGIDFGWRLLPDGALRVAALVGEQRPGEVRYDETVVLPRSFIEKDEHTDSLRSVRSKIFDEIRPRLSAWASEERAKGGFPEDSWAHKNVPYIHQWRSVGKVARLFREHGSQMPQSDPSETNPYGNLRLDVEAFLKQDMHLWRWEANERQKVLDQRREQYRLWAVDVARFHKRVFVEKLDLRAFSARGPVESGPQTDDRRYMRLRGLAAISVLRNCLQQACKARGVELVEVAAEFTTKTCRFCGHVDEDLDAASEVSVRCKECGKEDDQDLRAAQNILTLGLKMEAAEASGPAPMSERQRRFRKKRTDTDTPTAAE